MIFYLFSSEFKHLAILTRLSKQTIQTESESSIAKTLNYFIYPCNNTSFLTYWLNKPICFAKLLLKIKLSSEIIPTILFNSYC